MNAHDPVYRPYEELSADFFADKNLVKLRTPWSAVEAEVPACVAHQVSRVCAAINAKNTEGLEAELSEFLSVFEDQYFAYVQPRPVAFAPGQCTRSNERVRRSISATPGEWLEVYTPAVASRLRLRESWSLDVAALLDASRIEGSNLHDAVSAYRFIMRWAFRLVSTYSAERARLFEFLSTALREDEERFFAAIRYYVRQYHHVTSTSFDCLVPAIETLPFARELVTHLALEEKGHGAFTADSLKALGVREPALLPLGPHAVSIMDFLRLSAHLNPLGFACLFNVFELTGEQEEDPVAALIAKSSKPEAARGLQAHFKLNQDGAHFTNGVQLVKEMKAVDPYTVLEAARFTELHFMLVEGNCEEIIAHGSRIENAAPVS